jgi:hypothetical protein
VCETCEKSVMEAANAVVEALRQTPGAAAPATGLSRLAAPDMGLERLTMPKVKDEDFQ